MRSDYGPLTNTHTEMKKRTENTITLSDSVVKCSLLPNSTARFIAANLLSFYLRFAFDARSCLKSLVVGFAVPSTLYARAHCGRVWRLDPTKKNKKALEIVFEREGGQ